MKGIFTQGFAVLLSEAISLEEVEEIVGAERVVYRPTTEQRWHWPRVSSPGAIP